MNALVPSTNQITYVAADGSSFHGLDMLIKAWLHGKSSNTTESYTRISAMFLNYVGVDITHIGLVHIQSFIDSLEGKSLSTIKTYTMVVKSLMSFCKNLGLIQYNPGVLIKTQKPSTSRHNKTMEQVDLKMMFRCENNLRNKLIVSTLYYTGMRVSELVTRKWKDVVDHGDTATIYIMGKGRKERYVRIPNQLWKELKLMKGLPDSPLFVSREGKNNPLTRQQVFNVVKMASKRVDSEASPHWLRHFHATHAIENGASIHCVRDTLGHESIQTTSIYLDAAPKSSSSDYLK